MKKSIFKVLVCILAIASLCSCSSSEVLKTKEISDKITQTEVVIQSDILQQEDYANFFADFKSTFTIPGLLEGIIPQGICYDEITDYFIITGYYEDSALPSAVMCVDAKSGKLVGSHPLKNLDGSYHYGHVGGIAVSQNTVYITGSGECYTFPITDLQSVENSTPLQFKSRFKLNTLGSFACIHDDVLWVGDFIESDDTERENAQRMATLSSGETFYAFCEGYILEDGLPAIDKINTATDGYVPDYMLAIPEQVQGMAFTKTGKIIFSTSYGRRKNSVLYIYEDVLMSEKCGTQNIDEKNVDLYACADNLLKAKITAPPMSEGLTESPDGICLLFESGAAKYRNGNGKYPLDTAFVTAIE